MCHGGRLLEDFQAGTDIAPRGLRDAVAQCLTTTVDDRWVVWAYKIAWPVGKQFRAMTGSVYPVDAVAHCAHRKSHRAPEPGCTCGFHALSQPMPAFTPITSTTGSGWASRFAGARTRMSAALGAPDPQPVCLMVVLSGRMLAFEWLRDQVLFRAERQTVVRIADDQMVAERRPDDPSGRWVRRTPRRPFDVGPARLALPHPSPRPMVVDDDAGYCTIATPTPLHERQLAPV